MKVYAVVNVWHDDLFGGLRNINRISNVYFERRSGKTYVQ